MIRSLLNLWKARVSTFERAIDKSSEKLRVYMTIGIMRLLLRVAVLTPSDHPSKMNVDSNVDQVDFRTMTSDEVSAVASCSAL